MHILEAFARTYGTAGRLPERQANPGHGAAQSVPALSIAAYQAITALTNAVGHVRCAVRRYRIRRATIRDLQALDDRMLDDIGIPRGAIDRVADSFMDRDGQPCARRASPNMAANDNEIDHRRLTRSLKRAYARRVQDLPPSASTHSRKAAILGRSAVASGQTM